MERKQTNHIHYETEHTHKQQPLGFDFLLQEVSESVVRASNFNAYAYNIHINSHTSTH